MKKAKTLTVAELLTDKSKGAKKLAGLKGLETLRGMTKADNETLLEAFNMYEPGTPVGKGLKDSVISNLEKVLAVIADDLPAEIESLTGPVGVLDADKMSGQEKAEVMQDFSTVLFCKIAQPAFTACIDAKEWAERDRVQAGAAVPEPEGQAELIETPDPVNEVDPKRHFVVQKIYGKDFLRPLNTQRLEFFSWLGRHAHKADVIMETGSFIVPRAFIQMVDDKLAECIAERETLLDAFEAKYSEAKEDAAKRLGIHFDPARYPADFSEVRAKFKFDFRWRTIQPDAAMKEISKSMYEREAKKFKADYENSFEVVREGLRTGFAELVKMFADSLGTGADGKPKVFHASKIDKLKGFLDTFGAANLTGDAKLAEIAETAKALLTTIDPQGIRKDLDLRKELQKSFEKIGKQASKLVVVRGRKLDLEDE